MEVLLQREGTHILMVVVALAHRPVRLVEAAGVAQAAARAAPAAWRLAVLERRNTREARAVHVAPTKEAAAAPRVLMVQATTVTAPA